MAYTVQEVAKLSGTTIKTLYHYHKIGLLIPSFVGENGYRYYSEKELEQLQQIMFYRELDFSLEQIKRALENEPSRLNSLEQQLSLLSARKVRLTEILNTLEQTISHARRGVPMNKDQMFTGLNQKEWEKALEVQNEHLQKEYDYSIDTSTINEDSMNEKAHEATNFMYFMAKLLKDGVSANDERVLDAIQKHIDFMRKDMEIDDKGFAAQCRFFLTDDFHRSIMEGQQVGLSYYLCIAAENHAAKENS